MVDREDELATVRQAVDAARAGRGSVVVVQGDPGSGRTRLVREVAAEAHRMDFRIVWLPDSPDIASSIMTAAVDDAARGRPVVVVNDQGPPVSISDLGVDVVRLPVLAIVTETAPSAFVGEQPEEVGSERHVTRVRIRPLRPGAMMALAARMGTLLSIPVLERLYAATGGNALLVVETLSALKGVDALVDSGPWPLSERAMGWMGARLEAMTPIARHMLEAASVLGEECELALVARLVSSADLSHVRASLLSTALTTVRNGGERYRFVAPLARDLVYASLSAERRATLHAQAAAELGRTGTASPAMLAHHVLAASATGDARRCEHYVGRLLQTRAVPDAPVNPACWPYFVQEVEHWVIGFGERSIRLSNRTGLLYLARLLSRPGTEFAALALGERHRARNGSDEAPREPTLAAERARVRVTRRIRDGIERIARLHPELGAHLEQTIRTGAQCVYVADPVTAPRWEVRWSR